MIQILINKPIKLSGQLSCKVSFPFNQDIIDLIKTYQPAIWNKNYKFWEIGLNYLSLMLDDFCKLDQISLVVDDKRNLGDFNFGDLTQDEISSFKLPPFKHQLEAINYGLSHPKFLLLDSMGLGKTASVIWLAETLHKRGLIDHCLVICGVNAVKPNWEAEIRQFSNLSCRVLGKRVARTGKVTYGSIADRVAELKSPLSEFFVVTNIETIRSDKIVEALQKSKNKFGMIAVDEIHRCLTGDTVVQTDIGKLSLADLSKLSTLPKVLSYNKKTDTDEFQAITDICISDPTEPIVKLEIQGDDAVYELKCTASHKIYTTNRGWVKAIDLTEFDDIKIS